MDSNTEDKGDGVVVLKGFSYRTCLACKHQETCYRGLDDYGDPWEYATFCDLFKPRNLSLAEKIRLIVYWVLR